MIRTVAVQLENTLILLTAKIIQGSYLEFPQIVIKK
jgi:hypothetical protein